MKTIVYDRDFEELEIKPRDQIERYRRLLAEEVQVRLVKPGALTERACPGCRSRRTQVAFTKFGLTYVECSNCTSVFVSPCPSDDELTAFYRGSVSANFWRSDLWEVTRETRRAKIYQPLADWALDTLARYRPQASSIIDVGYHSRLLIDALLAGNSRGFRITVANPIADVEFAGAPLSGIAIHPTPLTAVHQLGPADAILAFELVPAVADVDVVLAAARASLPEGGLLLLTAPSISGFDLQVLWERSPNIYPPDRINLLSVEGLLELARRYEFEVLEFSTPGMFDVESVRQAIEHAPELPWPRFIRYMVTKREKHELRKFQDWLQESRLSSYARLAMRRS